MDATRSFILGPILKFLRGLRFPWLFGITAALFLVDLAVPDVIPFADELLLGLLATLFAALRRRRSGAADPPASSPR